MEMIASWPSFVWFGAGMTILVSALIGMLLESRLSFFVVFVISTALCIFAFYLTRMWAYGH